MNSKVFKIVIRIIFGLSIIGTIYLRNEIAWEYSFDIDENTFMVVSLFSDALTWFVLEIIGKTLENTETIIDNQNYFKIRMKEMEKEISEK